MLVFEGPVAWTEKMTETGPNATECNRTAVAVAHFLGYTGCRLPSS